MRLKGVTLDIIIEHFNADEALAAQRKSSVLSSLDKLHERHVIFLKPLKCVM